MAHRDDVGPVPEDNRPGHHPEVEQDQPPAEAFARRLGLVPPADAGAEDRSADAEPELPDVDPPGAGDADTAGDAPTAAEPVLARSAGTEWLATAVPDPAAPAAGPVRAGALLDAVGPPAGPVTPVEVIAETMELGVRFATAMALLPLRVTTASVRTALRLGGRGR